MTTIGFSRKVLAAVVAACGAQLIAIIVQFVSTGVFDRVAVAQVVGAILTALFGLVAGYHAPGNEVHYEAVVPGGGPPEAPAS